MSAASEITIREAVASDIPTLEVFEQAVVTAERPFDATLKPEGVKYYDLDLLISSPDSHLLVAEHNGNLIGSGYARIEESKAYRIHKQHCYLGFMYVAPEYRGKGFVGLILDELYRWTLSRGVTELKLEVYSENAPAIRAYEKAGFTPRLLEMRATIGFRSEPDQQSED